MQNERYHIVEVVNLKSVTSPKAVFTFIDKIQNVDLKITEGWTFQRPIVSISALKTTTFFVSEHPDSYPLRLASCLPRHTCLAGHVVGFMVCSGFFFQPCLVSFVSHPNHFSYLRLVHSGSQYHSSKLCLDGSQS